MQGAKRWYKVLAICFNDLKSFDLFSHILMSKSDSHPVGEGIIDLLQLIPKCRALPAQKPTSFWSLDLCRFVLWNNTGLGSCHQDTLHGDFVTSLAFPVCL